MMNRTTVLFVALAAFSACLWAEPVTITFLNGEVQVQTKGAWKTVDIGDTFDSSQTIKIAKGVILELKLKGKPSITLCASGTYVLDTMQTQLKPNSAVASVTQKLQKLATASTSKDTVVAGVRGDVTTPSGPSWSGGALEAEALIKSGLESHGAGKYMEAYGIFMEAQLLYLDEADLMGAARSAWLASQSGLAAGSGARALAALRSASPEDAGALRGSYALSLATLSLQYGAVADAKALLEKALANNWFDKPEDLTDAKSLLKAM